MFSTQAFVRGFSALVGAGILGLLAAIEILLAMPLPGWIYLFLGVSSAAVILQLGIPFGKGRFILILAVWGLLAALYAVPWTTRKPFLHQVNRIQPGMTESEVRRIMAGYREGTGWKLPGDAATNSAVAPAELKLANALVFRHSDDGRFNSDWAVITLANGKVIKVEFMPD